MAVRSLKKLLKVCKKYYVGMSLYHLCFKVMKKACGACAVILRCTQIESTQNTQLDAV